MHMEPIITYDDFKKLDMRLGIIRFVEPIEGADKLLRCLVQFTPELGTHTYTTPEGEEISVRQIVSGIREYVGDYTALVGKQVLYVVNLEPRMIRGVESHGMLMAVGDDDTAFCFITSERPLKAGSKIR